MPLGSESALGLAGPNGTPDIDELPAPAEPAGGVNCANALTGAIRTSAVKRTSAGLRDIEISPGSHHATIIWRARSLASSSSVFPAIRFAMEYATAGESGLIMARSRFEIPAE
jgi:hypothetical protein